MRDGGCTPDRGAGLAGGAARRGAARRGARPRWRARQRAPPALRCDTRQGQRAPVGLSLAAGVRPAEPPTVVAGRVARAARATGALGSRACAQARKRRRTGSGAGRQAPRLRCRARRSPPQRRRLRGSLRGAGAGARGRSASYPRGTPRRASLERYRRRLAPTYTNPSSQLAPWPHSPCLTDAS